MDEDNDPLKFLRENTSDYPLFSKMAQHHLSVPASSGPVETVQCGRKGLPSRKKSSL